MSRPKRGNTGTQTTDWTNARLAKLTESFIDKHDKVMEALSEKDSSPNRA